MSDSLPIEQPQYPEHEKQAKILDQSQAVGFFLDSMSAYGWHVAEWRCAGHYDPRGRHQVLAGETRDGYTWFHDRIPLAAGDGTEDDCETPELAYIHLSIEKMLARHFDIDLDKIEAEKRQMIESIRASQEAHA